MVEKITFSSNHSCFLSHLNLIIKKLCHYTNGEIGQVPTNKDHLITVALIDSPLALPLSNVVDS